MLLTYTSRERALADIGINKLLEIRCQLMTGSGPNIHAVFLTVATIALLIASPIVVQIDATPGQADAEQDSDIVVNDETIDPAITPTGTAPKASAAQSNVSQKSDSMRSLDPPQPTRTVTTFDKPQKIVPTSVSGASALQIEQTVDITPPSSGTFLSGGTYLIVITSEVESSNIVETNKLRDPSLTVSVSGSGVSLTEGFSSTGDYSSVQRVSDTEYAFESPGEYFQPKSQHTAVVRVSIPAGAVGQDFTVTATPEQGSESATTYTISSAETTGWEELADSAGSRATVYASYNRTYESMLERKPWEERTERAFQTASLSVANDATDIAKVSTGSAVTLGDTARQQYFTEGYGNGPVGKVAQINQQLTNDLFDRFAVDGTKQAGDSSKPLETLTELARSEERAWQNQNRAKAIEYLHRQQAVLQHSCVGSGPYEAEYDTCLLTEAQSQRGASSFLGNPQPKPLYDFFDALQETATSEYTYIERSLLPVAKRPQPSVTTDRSHSALESDLSGLERGTRETVTFVVSNAESAGASSGQGYLSFSHSEALSVVSVREVASRSDAEEPTIRQYPPGKKVNAADGENETLDSPLVDVYESYAPGAQNVYRVTFERQTDAPTWVRYRSAFQPAVDSGAETRFARAPTGTGYDTDEQGWAVINISQSSDTDSPPQAVIGTEKDGNTLFPGDSVTFTATDSSDESGIETYEWRFDTDGDGTTDVMRSGESTRLSVSDAGPKTATLRVTDTSGQTTNTSVGLLVRNRRQVSASFTPNVSNPDPGTPVEFRATVDAESYNWDLDDDGTFETTGPTAVTTFASSGYHNVTLRVTTSAANSDTTTLSVRIDSLETKISRPDPVIDAPSSLSVGERGTFDASASTDQDVAGDGTIIDGSISSSKWDLDSDGTLDATGTTVRTSFSSPGDKQVRLVVEDQHGNTGIVNRVITIRRASGKIAADAGDDKSVDGGTLVSLNGGKSSNSGSGVLEYSWEQIQGPNVDLIDENASTPEFMTPTTGSERTLVFELTVRSGGYSDSDQVSITIKPNQPPTVELDAPNESAEGTPVLLNAEGSDPEGDNLTYSFEIVSGPDSVKHDYGVKSQTYYEMAGIKRNSTAKFKVTVSDGISSQTDYDKVKIYDVNEHPTARIEVSQSTVVSGDEITLNGEKSSDPEINLVDSQFSPLGQDHFYWSGPFENNQSNYFGEYISSQPTISQTVPNVDKKKNITYQLIVKDEFPGFQTSPFDQQSDRALVNVTVHPNSKPIAEAGSDSTVKGKELVTLNGSGSTDPNTIDQLSYNWKQIDGPDLSIVDSETSTPKFLPPNVDESKTVTFELTVSDTGGMTDSDRVNVTLTPSGATDLTIEVDGERDNDSEIASIQEAVDLAPPNSTIRVHPGNYNKRVWITTANITLTGLRGANLKQTSSMQVEGQAGAVNILAPNVLIEGFEITGWKAGISSYEAGPVNWTARNVSLHNNSVGVDARYSAGWEIRDSNIVNNTQAGVVASSSTSGVATRNWWGNTSGPSDQCINVNCSNWLADPANIILYKNTSEYNFEINRLSKDVVEPDTAVELRLNYTSSVEDGQMRFSWNQTGGPTVTIDDPHERVPTITTPEVSSNTTLEFQLTVSDGKRSTSDTVRVFVSNKSEADQPGTGITADFTPSDDSVSVGTSVAFDASNSTSLNESIESFEWDFDGDGQIDETTDSPMASHKYDDSGEYTVTLVVTGANGESAETSASITVSERTTHESGVDQRVFDAVAGRDGAISRRNIIEAVGMYLRDNPINGVDVTRSDVLALVQFYLTN